MKGIRRGKNTLPRETKIRIPPSISEAMQNKRVGEIFKVLRGNIHQSRILLPVELSFKIEGEIEFLRQTKTEEICY